MRRNARQHRPRKALLGAVAALTASWLTLAGADGAGAQSPASSPTAPISAAGPAADLSHRLTGGTGIFLADPSPVNLHGTGFIEQEYLATGIAKSYTAAGPLSENGRWDFVPAGTAPYRTRIVVRRPSNPLKFSGTIVVEWLNVSGGVDADPEWTSLRNEILRSGDAWVGVSVQAIGVMGGPTLVKVPSPKASVQGEGLRKIDPARYSTLDLAGDAYSYDVYTQVAMALRTGAGLGGLHPKRVLAAGESQSAIALVTYYNGVQPLTRAFDGFFVHSRGSSGLPLVAPGQSANIAGAIGGAPTIFRTDQAAPVMDLQSETDVGSILNSYAARQPDSPTFRLWEVAGTSHADAHLVGPNADYIHCGVPINNGPMWVVAEAAYHDLKQWVAAGKVPPHAPRLEVAPGPTPMIVRNAEGIAQGGIRTPPVDVPVEALSGAPGPNPSTICLLLGSAKPFPAAQLKVLYPSRSVYLKAFGADAQGVINAGFVLPQDRAALLAFADPSAIPGPRGSK